MNTIITAYRSYFITKKMLDGLYLDEVFFKPNGTGPTNNKWLTKILKSLPSSKLTDECAKVHDICYRIGGLEIHREIADSIYYNLMRSLIKKECKWYNKHIHLFHAWRNYRFVRRFGKDSFNYNDNNFVLSTE